ncbi:MAG: hypothetical protein R6W89_12760 [Candidatus Hydrogenedentota bacterium]
MKLQNHTTAVMHLLSIPMLIALAPALAAAEAPFQIRVTDSETGRGVPLVELRTVNNVSYITDSNGVAAIHEPGFAGREVFFHVESHGYTYPEDGFGHAGTAVEVEPGGSVTLEVERDNIAERLYRITGEGIYRDSVLTGEDVPLKDPVRGGGVMGQDSAQTAIYRDQLYWIWGDTNRAGYPLGVFQSTGAVSQLPGQGGLEPDAGVNLEYFTDENGAPKAVIPIREDTSALIWLDGLMVVDNGGAERLAGRAELLHGLGDTIGHSLVVFDDERQAFTEHTAFDPDEPWRYPRGQTAVLNEEGETYNVFSLRFPIVRVEATLAAASNPDRYEAFTCLEPGGRMDGAESPVMRDDAGDLVWRWREDTDPVGQNEEQTLMEAGLIDEDETRFQVRDAESGDWVTIHRSSVQFNNYLDQWVLIGTEEYGDPSYLGEVWYAEAPNPTGPWDQATRIVTHDDYSFYNPVQHPYFAQDGGRYIYFEGTYTRQFTGRDTPTPRYDYNQIMYRLDLADERLR